MIKKKNYKLERKGETKDLKGQYLLTNFYIFEYLEQLVNLVVFFLLRTFIFTLECS